MCNPCSMLVQRDRVLWSRKTHSHTAMRQEFGVREEQPGLPIHAVAVEITPPSGDWNAPLEVWAFRTDQDILPDWWDAADGERRVRAALPEWVSAVVARRGETKTVANGDTMIAADGSRVEARGSSSVVALDSSSVEARDSSSVVAWDSSSVVAWDSSSVEARDSSSVVARDSSTVNQYGGTVSVHKYAVCIDRRNGKPACVTAEATK